MDKLEQKIDSIRENHNKKLQDKIYGRSGRSWIDEEFVKYSLTAYRVLTADAHYRNMIIREIYKRYDLRSIYFPPESYTAEPDPTGIWYDNASKFILMPEQDDPIYLETNVIQIINPGIKYYNMFIKNKWFIKLSEYMDTIISKAYTSRQKYIYTVISSPAKIDEDTHYIPIMIDLENNTVISFDPSKGFYIEGYIITLAVYVYTGMRSMRYIPVVPEGTGWQFDSSDIWCQTWALYVQVIILHDQLRTGKNLEDLVIQFSLTGSVNKRKLLLNFIRNTTIKFPKIQKALREQYEYVVKRGTEIDEEGYQNFYKELMEYVPNGPPSEILRDYRGIYKDLFPFEVTHIRREILLNKDPVIAIRNASIDDLFDKRLSFGNRPKRRKRRSAK